MNESIIAIFTGATTDGKGILFFSPNIGQLSAANESTGEPIYCEWCKGFGRVLGNRLCGHCKGAGVI